MSTDCIWGVELEVDWWIARGVIDKFREMSVSCPEVRLLNERTSITHSHNLILRLSVFSVSKLFPSCNSLIHIVYQITILLFHFFAAIR